VRKLTLSLILWYQLDLGLVDYEVLILKQENGVFSALEKGWLRAMDLIITSYASQPLKILEKYTYEFCYGEETLVTIEMPDGSSEVTFDHVRRDIRSVIKRIIELDRVLPRLPANRFMAVQLHYTDDKPDDFQPPGFQLASPTIFEVESDRGWKPVETKFGGIITEDHK
jgi:meiosis-specific protein HOP1